MRTICDLKVGDTWGVEKITRISKPENVLVTESYNEVSQRYELNFYHYDTMEHWYTKGL
jgi:hypothetical protein